MSRIAFLLLAHKDPERVVEQAQALTAHGDAVAIHYDRRSPAADYRVITDALGARDDVAFARRVRCGWGEFSLVEATLNLITAARGRFEGVTHYFLMSGDCYPTKSRAYIGRFLEENPDTDVIEVQDFFTSGWIRTGLKEERLIFRHYVNERARKALFYSLLEWQKWLGLARPLPAGIDIRIGSQWWLLRADTIEQVLELLRERRDLKRFFRTTWIPDETFFQTLVAHVVPKAQILCQPPTHLIFSDYGLPVSFHHDHFDYLRAQDRFFARKLSPTAHGLRRKLLDVFAGDPAQEEGGAPVSLYPYLAKRGRHGQRYAPRFWEQALAERREADVMVVIAKLWHVGKGITAEAERITGLTQFGYMFDEDEPLAIDLGNLERGLAKRNRHRQAFLNLVVDSLPEPRLILALDPARRDALADIRAKAGSVRLLLVERPLPDTHLEDHAVRTGLLGPASGAFERREVTKALAHEFALEIETLRTQHADILFENRLDRDRGQNVLDMGHFLRQPRGEAEALARAAETLTG